MPSGGLKVAFLFVGCALLILGTLSLLRTNQVTTRELRDLEKTEATSIPAEQSAYGASSDAPASDGGLPSDLVLKDEGQQQQGQHGQQKQEQRQATQVRDAQRPSANTIQDSSTGSPANAATEEDTGNSNSNSNSAAKPSPDDQDDPLEKYNIVHTQEYPLPDLKGVDKLVEMGYEIPKLSFDFDDSPEARVERAREKTAELVAEGMPESVAKLRAQLFERELADRKARAEHTRNRAIVRLRQEARVRKDAEEREARLQLMREKQRMVAEMLERGRKQREEELRQREERKRELEERAQQEEQEAERIQKMKEELRQQQLEKQQEENERRRQEEKKHKKKERQQREEQLAQEREEKRRLVEEFQAMRQQQLEENKRLAREERLKEMQEAAQMRQAQRERLGFPPKEDEGT